MQANNTVISIENVSKAYNRNLYRPSIRHDGLQIVKRLLGRVDQAAWQAPTFFALKNISFSVTKGEAVGIVGRNGAGKTTLLRLLSHISAPTEGSISIQGRFVSLIGLSAGFDVERTGYENIYLNTALYGLSAKETESLIPAIIEFSELAGFLDNPVKLYSSGMVGRLGFSIAIHILPDIVFLDEVLSVGDFAFQQKCYDRILQLKVQGKTLLFVSHTNDAIRKLCERTLWLHRGELKMDGPTEEVLEHYTQFATMTPDKKP